MKKKTFLLISGKLRVCSNSLRKEKLYKLKLDMTEKEFASVWEIEKPPKNTTTEEDFLRRLKTNAKETADNLEPFTFPQFEKNLFDTTAEKVKKELPKIYTRELLEVIFHQPYCKINHLVENNIVERQAAARYLKQLEDMKILHSKKIGRNIIYINTELY